MGIGPYFTEYHKAQGEAAAASAEGLDRRDLKLLLLPPLMLGLQGAGQPRHLPPVERRHLAPHGEGDVVLHLAEVELAKATEGTHERRVAPALVAQPQGLGRVPQLKREPRGVGLEPG